MQELQANLNNFVALIDEILEDEQSILIVQEFPHMIGDRSGRWFRWLENDFYYECLETIKQAEYRVIQPSHMINSKQCTVAICKKTSHWKQMTEEMFKYDSKHSYGNKLVELQCGKITLLGIHMNPSNEMWEMLLNSITGRKYTFLAGDFNAYELRGEMRDRPKQIRNAGYVPFIPSNVITDIKHKSSIDNIYMSNDYIVDCEITVNIRKLDIFRTNHTLCEIFLSRKSANEENAIPDE